MLAAIALPAWLGRLASGPPRWAGVALLVSGMLVGIASRWALGGSFTPYPRPLETGALAARGPYRFVRHPMYASIIVTFAGWALLW
jgi:protein-S-isoprenylcysteine O-methyltransferase Ste14